MAEHAVVADSPADRRPAVVEARIHRPSAPVFRIPREGKFDEGSLRGAMEIRANMVARADDVIDRPFLNVVYSSVVTDLPASLNPVSVLRDHLKPYARGAMKERNGIDDVTGRRNRECPGHAGEFVMLVNIGMAASADVGVYVSV